MNILVWGFSASGKSYLVEDLSKKLGYKVIHTSDVLKQISKNKKPSIKNTKKNDGWYEFSGLDKVRSKNKNIDLVLDKFLIDLVNSKKNYIFDSWTLPYLLEKRNDVISIYLKATKKTRIKRMALRDKVTLKHAKELLEEKDNFNIKHYKKLYRINIGDSKIFDIVIKTDDLSIKQVYSLVFKKLKKFI